MGHRKKQYIEDRKASYKHLTGGIRFINSIPVHVFAD